MKQYILLIMLSLTILGCNSQNDKPSNKNDIVEPSFINNEHEPSENKKRETDLSFINNEKLEYGIALRACDTCIPIRDIGYRVTIYISEDENMIVKKITPYVWLNLLNDSTSDFASNIILYSLYDMDAFRLSLNNNKIGWRKDMKSEDLEHWKAQFKK